MQRLARSAVFNGYIEVARSVGLDPFAVLSACNLPSACLTNPETKVPAASVLRLLEESAKRSGKSDFGLRLAEKRSFSNLGVLALLVREQATTASVLDVLVGYMHLHNEALRLHVDVQDGNAILTLAIDLDRIVPMRQGIELGIGFLHRSLQRLLGSSWKPNVVCFAHGPPMRSDAHRRFFGITVEFNQDYNGIVFPARDIDAPVPAADAALAGHVRQYLDTLSSRPRGTTLASVRDCIEVLLPLGTCSANRVAKHLGVDRRTIHRRLARDGETFAKMLDHARVELATRCITSSDRRLSDISIQLGFSCLSAFSRWFRARFGQSVTQWRAAQPEFRPGSARRQNGAGSASRF